MDLIVFTVIGFVAGFAACAVLLPGFRAARRPLALERPPRTVSAHDALVVSAFYTGPVQ